MNTLIIAFFAVLAVVAAAPPSIAPQEPIPIVSQVSDSFPDGSYVSSFESGNGIKQSVQGKIVGEGKDASPYVEGSWSYTAPDGTLKAVRYVAGPDGFVATGDDIPQTPEYIVKSLAWQVAHPYVEKPEVKAL